MCQIVIGDQTGFGDQSSGFLIDEGRPEVENNVQNEKDFHKEVEKVEETLVLVGLEMINR